MSAPSTIDAGRLGIMLNELRLPSRKAMWADFAARADKKGWPAARFLGTLAEHGLAERDRRRIERHLVEARLPPGKTLESFDLDAVPMISKAQVSAVAAGDAWLKTGVNLMLFGPPGGGKSHLAAAIGLILIAALQAGAAAGREGGAWLVDARGGVIAAAVVSAKPFARHSVAKVYLNGA